MRERLRGVEAEVIDGIVFDHGFSGVVRIDRDGQTFAKA